MKQKIIFIIVGVLLAVGGYSANLAKDLLKSNNIFGSIMLDGGCYTALATTTRVFLDSNNTASTTLFTCSAGSANGIALNFMNEASTTGSVSYAIQSSQNNIDFYDVAFGQIDVKTSTTTKQITQSPFYGSRVRVQVKATATTSTNVRLLVAEEIAR